ncbi:MAG TPA: hypothetical protein VFP50_19810 [Anaeromyxobacteraceae bacterium]|nr:hypothetical protein [Anaeromyxobacteraceae bacterium]
MDDLLLTAIGPAFLAGSVVLAIWVDLREARAAGADVAPDEPTTSGPVPAASLGRGGRRLRLVHDADR